MNFKDQIIDFFPPNGGAYNNSIVSYCNVKTKKNVLRYTK